MEFSIWDLWDGAAQEGACLQAWQTQLTSGIHMKKGETSFLVLSFSWFSSILFHIFFCCDDEYLIFIIISISFRMTMEINKPPGMLVRAFLDWVSWYTKTHYAILGWTIPWTRIPGWKKENLGSLIHCSPAWLRNIVISSSFGYDFLTMIDCTPSIMSQIKLFSS